MNSPDTAPASQPRRQRSRLRFELIFASAWLAVGLFLMPALIYLVGASVLGPYGDDGGTLGRFYANFFRDLADPSGRAWALALGPLLLISLVRALFLGMPPRHPDGEDEPPAHRKEVARPSREHTRVEPRVGLD
jgi:hypothetical protein